MNKEPEEDKLEEAQVIYSFSTVHDHEYQDAGINAMGLREVICTCGHGMQVDSSVTVSDGKLVYSV